MEENILDLFAVEFSNIVEKYCKYIIVSGYVAISHGRSRGTEDIDMIIARIPLEVFILLHSDLIKNGFECIQSKDPKIVHEYLSDNISVRYIRNGKFLPEMEVKFAKDEIDEHQLKSRVKLPLSGVDVFFSSIEANLAFKEELLKSDKDIEDSRHLRIVYEGKIDEQEVERIKKQIKRLRVG